MEHAQGERALRARHLVVVQLHRVDGAAAEFIVLGVGSEDGREQNAGVRALRVSLHFELYVGKWIGREDWVGRLPYSLQCHHSDVMECNSFVAI